MLQNYAFELKLEIKTKIMSVNFRRMKSKRTNLEPNEKIYEIEF